MDTFSLEDDDYGDMFITQSSKHNIEIVPDDDNSNKELFLGLLKNDFSSHVCHYWKVKVIQTINIQIFLIMKRSPWTKMTVNQGNI